MHSHRRQPQLSQNFLHNRQLVKQLVRKTSIGPQDTVIEIGPGQGIISQELQVVAKLVLAVELDSKLISYLINQPPRNNLVLFHLNALDFPLPATPYKVFSNLPFAIEGELIRKLLHAPNPPQQASLIVRKESAIRWAGVHKHTLFSIMYQPWFTFDIVHHFKSTDFKPKTKVPAVLLQITRRSQPLLPPTHQQKYWQFVKDKYQTGQPPNLPVQSWIRLFVTHSWGR